MLVFYLRSGHRSCFLNCTGRTHRNIKLLGEIVSLINKPDTHIHVLEVKAHRDTGVVGNEFADATAKHAGILVYGRGATFCTTFTYWQSLLLNIVAHRWERWDYPISSLNPPHSPTKRDGQTKSARNQVSMTWRCSCLLRLSRSLNKIANITWPCNCQLFDGTNKKRCGAKEECHENGCTLFTQI